MHRSQLCRGRVALLSVAGSTIVSKRGVQRAQWRLLGAIAAMLAVYAAISSVSAIPGTQLAPGSAAHHSFFIGEIVFEVLLTGALVYAIYRVVGTYLSTPIHHMHTVLQLLAEVTDAREHAVYGHCYRVSALSRRIAEGLGMSPDDVERVAYAGLLHDVGKIGIPDAILLKAGPLNDDEREVMMEHAALGANLVSRAGALAAVAPLVRHHHEWWNGRGYADGLAGEAIPIGACIIAVADAVDTITTGRPYRAARPMSEALAELRRCSGRQFSPRVVEAACAVLGEGQPAIVTPAVDPVVVTLAEQAERARARRQGQTA